MSVVVGPRSQDERDPGATRRRWFLLIAALVFSALIASRAGGAA